MLSTLSAPIPSIDARKNVFATSRTDRPFRRPNGSVEVNMFICATSRLEQYQIDGAHEDYDDLTFTIEPGEVLGIAGGHLFIAAKDYDSLKNISAIMQIERSTEKKGPIKVNWGAQKIIILLSEQDYNDYTSLKVYEQKMHSLTCSIVLPVLTRAISMIRSGSSDEIEDLRELRWFDVIRQRCEELDPDQAEDEPLVLAQLILELPLRRSLAAGCEEIRTQ
jgi:hypothetical protein